MLVRGRRSLGTLLVQIHTAQARRRLGSLRPPRLATRAASRPGQRAGPHHRLVARSPVPGNRLSGCSASKPGTRRARHRGRCLRSADRPSASLTSAPRNCALHEANRELTRALNQRTDTSVTDLTRPRSAEPCVSRVCPAYRCEWAAWPCGISIEMSRRAGWLRALRVAWCAVRTDWRWTGRDRRRHGRSPGLHPAERLEQRGHRIIWDERSAVGDVEVDGRCRAAGAQRDPAAGMVMPDSVVDQVLDHALQQLRVSGCLGRVEFVLTCRSRRPISGAAASITSSAQEARSVNSLLSVPGR